MKVVLQCKDMRKNGGQGQFEIAPWGPKKKGGVKSFSDSISLNASLLTLYTANLSECWKTLFPH